jgi:glycosyltransferase involved in cell wall biosynthesis
MMCGTPVIAFNRGSMEELIINRKTGFLVQNTAEAVNAIANIKMISRLACREHAMAKFSSQVMARHYMHLYEKVARIPGGL